ncbi:HNH endonuclease [Salinimicrobium catena]|uniref:HNH endonuclease n=1 Tax=Salinimicrobium catena TaxID=390640 RepID=A0A1H5N4F5_9FLAO|nr:DUF3427 domain-containing protein [Salinimicrobium catena]SDL36586.1 HNH endonuclease [Salinimicrobium catena]SEE96416.1 HNH endonuclease [Salinimicrobium catena]
MSNDLILGAPYSKKDLVSVFKVPEIKGVQKGRYHLKGMGYDLLFVNLNKSSTAKNLHYNDFFEGEIFHWDSENREHMQTPGIERITRGDSVPLLFVRLNSRIKGITQPYIYCGKLEFLNHIPETSKPVHILFKSVDFDATTTNPKLKEIYSWRPGSGGNSPDPIIFNSKSRSTRTKPNKTERRGLITSRVGQGFYRDQIFEKWKKRCPVTRCDISEILIASHIVPWSKATDEERLDPDNGILLSPFVDALFDKHLISFQDDGSIIFSNKIDDKNLQIINLPLSTKIEVNEGMKKYLRKHREELKRKEVL